MSTNNSKMVNAWIYMGEKDPVVGGKVIGYDNPASSYQALIKNNVYQSVDILLISFMNTVPTGPKTIPTGDGSSYTVTMDLNVDQGNHHPNGWTNEDYMNFVIRDARKNNPKIKIMVTLLWGEDDVLSRIFSNKKQPDQKNADLFAANLVAYLKNKKLDGFDIDWESNMFGPITQDKCKILFNSIGAAFKKQTDKHYYFSISPAELTKLQKDFVNNNVGFINLQLYYDPNLPGECTRMGINKNLLAQGVSFESGTTVQQAYAIFKQGGYSVVTNWRLNSSNFPFEQTSQQQLFKLVHS